MTANLDKAAAYIKAQVASGALDFHDLARLVERAQLAMGLEADGMPGPITVARLDGFFIETDLTPPPMEMPSLVVPGPSKAQRALERARSMVGRGRYHLGAGGKDPKAPDPFDSDGTCDCSGFQAWCYGMPRKHDGVWFYTDHLEADAKGQVKGDLGDGVPWEQARPGDLVVYGAGPKVGHVGMISAVNEHGPTMAIHCRSGAPPAVVETGVSFFKARGAVILRMR